MSSNGGQEEYDIMYLLDRLESLREEMTELGIDSRNELDAKIASLHRQLDEVGD